ncbi:hypothetical protein EG327_004158 [Venturia inaequalis]|uniref:Uncharacterized protein n=1 Tax=Venturia inaequalis TaxID=5025 RepID=A0A8H3VD29_VENIN|nr:hypothetical protein EG327_004158 [Venturia inaequalis]
MEKLPHLANKPEELSEDVKIDNPSGILKGILKEGGTKTNSGQTTTRRVSFVDQEQFEDAIKRGFDGGLKYIPATIIGYLHLNDDGTHSFTKTLESETLEAETRRKASSAKAPSASQRTRRGEKAITTAENPVIISESESSDGVSDPEEEEKEVRKDEGDQSYVADQLEQTRPEKRMTRNKRPRADPSVDPEEEEEEEAEEEEGKEAEEEDNDDDDEDEEEEEIVEQEDQLVSDHGSDGPEDGLENSTTMLEDAEDEDIAEANSNEPAPPSSIPQDVQNEWDDERADRNAADKPTSSRSTSASLKRKSADDHEATKLKRRRRINREEEVKKESEEEDVPVDDDATIEKRLAEARKADPGKPARKKCERASPPAKKDKGKGKAIDPGPPDDDPSFSSSDPSDDSDHMTDPEDIDIDMDLTENPIYNTFDVEMAEIAQTQMATITTSIGTYVTGTTNQAMRRLNAATKEREKRREKRRKDRKRARRAQRIRRTGRPHRSATPVVDAGQTDFESGIGATDSVEHEGPTSRGASHKHTPSEPESVHGSTQEVVPTTAPPIPDSPDPPVSPVPEPEIQPSPPRTPPVVPQPKEEKREKCRSKTCPDPDEPGCGNYGNGIKNKENPLVDCAYRRCKYRRFCRNCKEGRDASGALVKGKGARKTKGVSVEDENVEGGVRWYCSSECSGKDKKDGNDDGNKQVRCRSKTSKEQDVPGCGRKFTEENEPYECKRECGRDTFCGECADGINKDKRRIKAKGYKVYDKSDDKGFYYYCSEECRDLDLDQFGGVEGLGYGPADPKPAADDDDDDDDDEEEYKDYYNEVPSDDDEKYPPSQPGQAKNPDGTHCQNKVCAKPFNDKRKPRKCENPDCVKNKGYCKSCTTKTSTATNEKQSGRWTVKPKKWFCCDECRKPIWKQLMAEEKAGQTEEREKRAADEAERERKAEKAAAAKPAAEEDDDGEGEDDADAVKKEKIKATTKTETVAEKRAKLKQLKKNRDAANLPKPKPKPKS